MDSLLKKYAFEIGWSIWNIETRGIEMEDIVDEKCQFCEYWWDFCVTIDCVFEIENNG